MIAFSSLRMKLPDLSVAVGGESLQSARQLRNLGLTLDVHLTMNARIKRVCQVSYFRLKTIRIIQNALSPEALGRLVHAFVTVRLDHCNSILIGIQVVAIQKLQLLQNSAAQLVSKTNR